MLRSLLIIFSLQTVFSLTCSAQIVEWVNQFATANNLTSDYDEVWGFVSDSTYIYTIGVHEGADDFDPDTGTQIQTGPQNDWQTFITKMTHDGDLVWAKFIGVIGNSESRASDIAVDGSGNIYITGTLFGSVDLDPGPASVIDSSSVGACYVSKLDSLGNLIWTRVTHRAVGITLELDNLDNVIITGWVRDSATFTDGSLIETIEKPSSVTTWPYTFPYMAKYSTGGAQLWVKGFNSVHGTHFIDCVTDAIGNIYITGKFSGSFDIDPDTASTWLSSNGGEDILLAKFSPSGDLDWGYGFGSVGQFEMANSIAINSNQHIVIGVRYNASFDIDPSASTVTVPSPGTEDALIASFDSAGNFLWHSIITGYLGISDLAIASDQSIYCSGWYDSTFTYSPEEDSVHFHSVHGGHGYVLALDDTGGYRWFQHMLDTSDYQFYNPSACSPARLTVSPQGELFAAGSFMDTINFNGISSPAVELSTVYGGYEDGDVFHMKFKCALYLDTFVSQCDSFYWGMSENTYYSSGVYFDTLWTNPCAEVHRLELEIHPAIDSTIDTVHACKAYAWPVNGQVYFSSIVLDTTLTSANGCDSVVVLDLTVTQTSYTNDTVVACSSYYWSVTDSSYSTSGVYSDTLDSQYGCDSIVQLFLSLGEEFEDTVFATSCGPYYWAAEDSLILSSGVYTSAMSSSLGCDSIEILSLSIGQSFDSLTEVSACNSYTWQVSNVTYHQSGVYLDSFSTSAQCDSVFILDLEITTVDATVIQSGDSLVAQESNGTYQWLDCNEGKAPISGATGKAFNPPQSGSYAVVITKNGCIDTSSCKTFTIMYVVDTPSEGDVYIFPNPTTGTFTAVSHQGPINSVRIFDPQGSMVYHQKLNGSNQSIIDPGLSAGVYFIQLALDGSTPTTLRLIVQ